VAGYHRPPAASLTPPWTRSPRGARAYPRVGPGAPTPRARFPSLVTSRYPSEIAWQKQSLNYSNLLPATNTFFETAGGRGPAPDRHLLALLFHPRSGHFPRDFSSGPTTGPRAFADSNKDIPSPRIVPRVIARLRKAAQTGERFVLWTHLFEPHSSYMEHPEFPNSLSGVQGLEEKYDYEIAFRRPMGGQDHQDSRRNQAGPQHRGGCVRRSRRGVGRAQAFFHGQDLTEEQLACPCSSPCPDRNLRWSTTRSGSSTWARPWSTWWGPGPCQLPRS